MAVIGKINPLKIVKEVEFGLYLDGGSDGEILLPGKYKPENYNIGDTLDVFLYKDSEDRLIATTLTPKVMVGEFAVLQAVSVSKFGAFLDWGLPKELLVPFREQQVKMQEGEKYPVFVYVDYDSDRITASSKIDKFIDEDSPDGIKKGDEVDIIVYNRTNLGWKAVVNQLYSGLIYSDEVFSDINIGYEGKAYIKQIRDDGKIDLSLRKEGYERISDFDNLLIDKLKSCGGFLPYNDKSHADSIYSEFGVSKRTFKNALGDLYKKRIIDFKDNGIKLVRE